MNILNAYKDLKGEKQYWKFFTASMVSRFGDSIDAIAYSWMAYELTGSATWLAVIMGINAVPSILFQPFAGVLVERMSKKALMVWTDVGRGAVVLLTAVLLYLGYLSPWMLLVFTFINSTLEAFRLPAGMAAYPEIVPKEKYTLATSLSQSLSQVAQIVGLALAGLIIALVGTSGAMMIDALTFFASGIILSFLHLSKPQKSKESFNFKSYGTDLKEGFRYLKSRSVIFAVCLLGTLMSVVLVPLNTFQAAYINESLALGATALSASSIALLIGMSLGAYLFPMLNKKWSRYTLLATGWAGMVITYVGLALLTTALPVYLIWLLLIIICFFCGCIASFIMVSVNVAFMEHVEKSYLARAGSIFNAMAMAATPFASFIFAGAAAVLTINQIFFAVALLALVALIPLCISRTLKQL